MKETGERASPKDTLARGNTVIPREAPSLTDIGVTKVQSSRWQKLAAMPDEKKAAVAAIEMTAEEKAAEKKSRRAEHEQALAVKQRALPDERYGVVIYLDP